MPIAKKFRGEIQKLREKLYWEPQDLLEVAFNVLHAVTPAGTPTLNKDKLRGAESGLSMSNVTTEILVDCLNYGYKAKGLTPERPITYELLRELFETDKQTAKIHASPSRRRKKKEPVKAKESIQKSA